MSIVLGYHGCRGSFAHDVRSGAISFAQWELSQNEYDWLGMGVYFWEGSRTRAAEWAKRKFGRQADVLEVEIELGFCLNMIESTYHGAIRKTYLNLRTAFRRRGLNLPINQGKRHDLDCLVINRFVQVMGHIAAEHKMVVQTVRGVFEEGKPLYPGSALRIQSHVQVAVRDVKCLLRLRPDK